MDAISQIIATSGPPHSLFGRTGQLDWSGRSASSLTCKHCERRFGRSNVRCCCGLQEQVVPRHLPSVLVGSTFAAAFCAGKPRPNCAPGECQYDTDSMMSLAV